MFNYKIAHFSLGILSDVKVFFCFSLNITSLFVNESHTPERLLLTTDRLPQ